MKDCPHCGFARDGGELCEMSGARRDAGFCLDKINDVKPKTPREIGPGIMVGYKFHPRERSHQFAPSLHVFFQLFDEALTVLNDTLALLRKNAVHGFRDRSGYGDGVL